ncbi:peptidase inhibitor family I36 protein [Micromonospora sp. KC721]|uniref:peptidase inhibitor family I36 protein n=1 Tax=Micromonospora sp. KC721 TaxID=2530380 RepID=UPI0014055B6A|nr:peptidase inhibitor family I36 protein [Micromonospora sp. KC721]
MKRFRLSALRTFLAASLVLAGSMAVVRINAATAAGPLSEARDAAVRLDRLVQHNPGARKLAPNAVRLPDGVVLSFPMAGVAEDKCSYEDVCLFEHENFGGERLRFSLCAVYELRHYSLSDGRLWSTQVSSVINRLPAGSWTHIWHKGGAPPAEEGMAKWELLHSSRAVAADQPAQQFPTVGWNDRAEVVKPARIPTAQCL